MQARPPWAGVAPSACEAAITAGCSVNLGWPGNADPSGKNGIQTWATPVRRRALRYVDSVSGLLADDITADCVSSGRAAKVGYSMAARARCCQPLRALFMYLFTLWRGPGFEHRPSN